MHLLYKQIALLKKMWGGERPHPTAECHFSVPKGYFIWLDHQTCGVNILFP